MEITQQSDTEVKNGKPRAQRRFYPVISLPDAIARIGQVWEHVGPSTLPDGALANQLGMSATSNQFQRVRSAMCDYGLLEKDGRGEDKTYRISESGKHFIQFERSAGADPDQAADFAKLIHRALMGPTMFQRIFEAVPDPNKTDAVRLFLEFQQGLKGEPLELALTSFVGSWEFYQTHATIDDRPPEAAEEADPIPTPDPVSPSPPPVNTETLLSAYGYELRYTGESVGTAQARQFLRLAEIWVEGIGIE